jgi:NAD(P)-dependent dehydrogenase (short-subunit alcohol dehydrogenase family)
MDSLEDRVVLITGASSGVGFAAAEAFARAGADVALLARTADKLEEAAEGVRRHGREALVVPTDITDREAVDRAVERTVQELGGIDVLVLSAASTVFGTFEEVDPDAFDRVVAVTFTGTVNCVRAALPALERRAGVVLAVGSLMTKVPLPTFTSYAAAKHAERGFLNSLRVELLARSSGVQVAMVHPGSIDTPVWESTETATGELPRKPPGQPPELVAEALVAAARDPRPESTFGADTVAIEWLWQYFRPAGDLLLAAVHHYYRSGGSPKSDAAAALDAVIGAIKSDALPRPSVGGAVRVATTPLRAASASLRTLRGY